MQGLKISRRRPGKRKPRAHLLHIGKTAGTAIKHALEPVAKQARYDLKFHGHRVTLADIPQHDRVFFVVRDPIDRYVSGFYSRQRQGRPRYEYPWSPEEEVAFTAFATADELGMALSAADLERRHAAEAAMNSIQHVRDSYWKWFCDPKYFDSRADDVLAVMWMPTVGESFPHLCERLGVSGDVSLPTDDASAHRNPYAVDKRLSDTARDHLKRWYADDYAFVETCTMLPSFMRGSGTSS
jgi:hypothetical protein